MTQKEFRERKEKSKKCMCCIDFFGIHLCFYNFNKEMVKDEPFRISAPLCLDLEKCPIENNEYNERLKMAKNFDKAGSVKTFSQVGKASSEKAQVITVKMIPNEKLHDYPNNREDVKDTTDLENSIKQLGFIDPIEVTDFGQAEGEYMIVSGHRRRQSGVNVGMNLFPSIVRHFNSEAEVENYVLLANSQRDSAKDPLLFCRRYKMHEEYLKSIGFKGSIRDEIAKRLGISKSHADRFNNMNKIIFPVWDMVRDETVGMSSVMPLASHNEGEQLEIYNIMQDALNDNVSLTRDTIKLIVEGYRMGKKTWISIIGNNNDTPVSSDEQLEGQTSFEETDEASQKEDNSKENGKANKKESSTVKKAKDIQKALKKLDECFDSELEFADIDEAEDIMANIKDTLINIIDGMFEIANDCQLKLEFKKFAEMIQSHIEDYKYQ